MNTYKQVYKSSAIISVIILLLVHNYSFGSERREPMSAWRSSRADIQFAHGFIAARSALSEEENRKYRLFLDAVTSPDMFSSSVHDRKLTLAEQERHQIGTHLRKLLGSTLLPNEADEYIGAYERIKDERAERKYQLSYLLGNMKVAIGGDLDGYSPLSVTVVLAQSDRVPHADLNISEAFSVDDNPIMEIVEVEDGEKKRLYTTLLHYDNRSPSEEPKGIVPF